jgi:cytidine deaminase
MSSAPPTNPLTAAEQQRLRELAQAAAENSYSPYSHFRVGAALLLTDGSIITGCNVENCSYRLTSCAEQAAIARAVSGACRQTLSEFGDDNVLILYPGEDGANESTTLGALLPHAFRMQFLNSK